MQTFKIAMKIRCSKSATVTLSLRRNIFGTPPLHTAFQTFRHNHCSQVLIITLCFTYLINKELNVKGIRDHGVRELSQERKPKRIIY